jgi:hypothetical protein
MRPFSGSLQSGELGWARCHGPVFANVPERSQRSTGSPRRGRYDRRMGEHAGGRRLSVAALAGVTAAALLATVALPILANSADGWSKLERPLHLPHLKRGVRCPVSSVDRRVAWRRAHIFGVSGIGRGPAYPGLGFQHGLIRATTYAPYGGPWLGEKVFWYVLPSYRGPVLIRGRRLDGRQVLGFNGNRRPDRELRIPPHETVTWQGQPRGSRGIPSAVRVTAAGCYGFQIDGTNFSRVVVVRALTR